MKITSQSKTFAAIVSEISPEDIANDFAARVKNLLDEFGVVALRSIGLTDDQLIGLARGLGPLQGRDHYPSGQFSSDPEDAKSPIGIFTLTNMIGRDGQLRAADDPFRANLSINEAWHSDGTFYEQRTLYSLLQGEIVPPEGGATEFADVRTAYLELPPALKDRVDNARCIHSGIHARKRVGYAGFNEESRRQLATTASRTMVIAHPHTGKPCLCVPSHVESVVGLDEERSEAMLAELRAFAGQPQYVYRHEWQVGDLVIWDNVATLHRATVYDDLKYPRRMRSIRVLDPSDKAEMVAA